MNAIISVENVTKRFEKVTALSDVSFEVQQGETFALLGPNGAGKTTTVRTILDLIRPDSGRVSISGRPFAAEDRNRIGFLPEERGLYARRKVLPVIEYFGTLKGLSATEAQKRGLKWLERFEIPEHRDKKIGELSKGNQQKVQLAATLVADPEIVLLDEPFSGLDPVNVRLVSSVIQELHQAGKTILLSSHQMSLVESLCDRLVMFARGHRVLYGRITDIRKEYSDNAVVVRSSATYEGMAGVERVVANGEGAKVFLKPGMLPTQFLAELLKNGAAVESYQTATTPLEDIFVKMAQSQPTQR